MRRTPGRELRAYSAVLELADAVLTELADLGPRDQIDIQSFLCVVGSDEYADQRRPVA